MTNRFKYLIILFALALLFWGEIYLFRFFNFWIEMMFASSLLAGLGLYVNHVNGEAINYRLYYFEPKYIIIGILSSAVLYGVMFAAYQILKLIYPYTDTEITFLYSLKSLLDIRIVIVLLMLFIGPAEEVFWRGFIQDTLQEKFGDTKGWLIASVLYSLIYIVSLNLMLVLAALFLGLFWGYIFKRFKSLWPSIISHSFLDLIVFVLLPLQ